VPDLADVRRIAADLRREPSGRDRPAVALYGTSYGAYLALLAIAAEPHGWSRCVAVAPFLSAPALHRDGPPSVRSLVDRLDGHTVADDELGPRDLLRLADRIRVPLLVVHGAQDPIIPVAHSRRLVRRLRAGGQPTDYREVPDAGHDPLVEPGGARLAAEVVAFLTGLPDRVAPVPARRTR
jgi:dipeptidyl aminopeptidase/acylaminoacyl peptidase